MPKTKLMEFIIVVMYFILILIGIKEFLIWSQITAILTVDSTENSIIHLASAFYDKNPHFIRAALIFPIVAISNYFSLDTTLFYSIIVGSLIVFSYKLISRILENYIKSYKILSILIFFIILSFFMHGRIVFSIFGNTLLLYLLYSNSKKYITRTIIFTFALWFVSVSSGTLTVFLFTILMYIVLSISTRLPYISRKKIYLLIVFFLMLGLLSPILISLVQKNLLYFDGSIIHMMTHGFGHYLVDYYFIVLPTMILLPFIVLLFNKFLKKNNIYIPVFSMMISSSTIGLFGFSSLVSGIPAYILFFYFFINKSDLRRQHA